MIQTHRPPMLEGGETADERVVGVSQIFFSTTDDKGVITAANRTFSNMARYPFEALLGAPHSIIRHQDMPAGVFKIMWDRLEAGLPVAAYVKNLAADGRFYWVFATVTEIQGGFLSVRTRPMFEPLWEAADGLYRAVRPQELSARQNGANRRQTAEVGVGLLHEGLVGAGFAGGFEDFMTLALPEEVSARQRVSSTVIPANAKPGTGLGAIVGGSQVLEQRLNALLAQLDAIGELASQLRGMSTRNLSARRLLTEAAEAAVTASTSDPSSPPAIVNGALAVQEWVSRAVTSLDQLGAATDPVPPLLSTARFGIALALLHNEMVLSFAAEVSDLGLQTDEGSSIEKIPLLAQAIVGDIERLSEDLSAAAGALERASGQVLHGLEALQRARSFIASWSLAVNRHGLPGVAQALSVLDSYQDGTLDHARELARLSDNCLQLLRQIDPYAVLEPLPVIEAGTQEILGGQD